MEIDGAPTLVELYRHNSWANLRLIDACRELPQEQLDWQIEATYGGIGETLVHLVAAQERYIGLLSGEPGSEALQESGSWPGWDVLRRHAQASSRELERLAARTPAAQTVRRVREGRTYHMPAWVILVQLINHGTEHREQVKATLTRLGIQPPPLDGWTYARQAGHIREEGA